MISLLWLNISEPFRVGVYKDYELIDQFQKNGKASDAIPTLLDIVLKRYNPDELLYTNGPGNNISLKVAFVSLRALSIAKKIPLHGISPFLFNGGAPIKAFGNSYFALTNGKIELKVFKQPPPSGECILPKRLPMQNKWLDSEPLFLLSPV